MAEHKPARDRLHDSLSTLDDGELPLWLRTAVKGWLKAVSRRRTNTDVGEWVARVRTELRRIDVLLDEYERESAKEVETAPDALQTGRWWHATRRRINVARREGAADSAVAEWLAAWALALSLDDFRLCATIARARGAIVPRSLAEAMRSVADAVSEPSGDPQEFRMHLRVLLSDEDRLRIESATVLGVLMIRSLREDGFRNEAAEVAGWLRERVGQSSEAQKLAVADTLPTGRSRGYWRSLALAVSAEVALDIGALESARQFVGLGSADADLAPDLLAVAAQLAESDGLWLSADGYCDAALDHGYDPRARALGRVVPARLRVRAATRLRESEPDRALAELEAALESGITGAGAFPEIDVLVEEASLLEQLGRESEASSELVKAANLLQWSGFPTRALEVFERACRMESAPALAWWSYAEALRMEAEDADSTVDDGLLRSAADAMETGLQISQPGSDDGWVLVTQGLILDALHPDSGVGLQWLERALLRDESYQLPYGFLALTLRRHGYLHPALAAAEQGARPDTGNDFLRRVYLSLLLDHGELTEGVGYVEELRLGSSDTVTLEVARAVFQQRLGQSLEAVRTLEALTPDQDVRFELGSCLEVIGEQERARRQYEDLREEAHVAGDGMRAGWAAYRLGDLEVAIELYTDLAARAPAHTSYACDLGQMHLARGDQDRDDLTTGEELLRRGVRAMVSRDDLLRLQTVELPALRADVAGRDHAAAVEDVLGKIEPEIVRRRSELLSPQPLPDSLWGRLCAAREAMHRGDPATAVDVYCAMIDDEEIPADEAGYGLLQAALALFAEADRTVMAFAAAETEVEAADELGRARQLWGHLDQAATRLAEGAQLAVALAARRAVVALAQGDDSAQPHLAAVLPHELAVYALSDAIDLVAADLATLWRVHDALVELARTGPGLTTEHRELVVDLARSLPLETTYRLRQDDVPRTETTRIVHPIEVRLGRGHQSRSDELQDGITCLQVAVGEEMGLSVPGIRRKYVDELPADQFEVRLYGEVIDRRWIDPFGDACLADQLAAVEQALRLQLHRLLGPDDVRLWLAGWSAEPVGGVRWQPADALESLRLARVLRMLLREGVPIVDRGAILEAFLEVDSDDGATPLAALRRVRSALGSAALVVPAETTFRTLPPELERRVAAGLGGPEGAIWAADRATTVRLVNDLRAWLGTAEPDASPESYERVVVVEDPGVRPFTWRLLAGERPRIYVLAREELR